ncbi:hypothetical protein [Nostoc sp. TCL240-02]|uniref:hypothetical protein n=1 Tax=Nostoc sp. TCL240-02 TaxID=2572090 RepID=UPI00157FB3AA|nr:hypothetical protein [Nostoc sp. TCL240-02]QKQ75587.1 hypothetical protein FBB35_21900 [Nostoc sp. TCL240-02]
MTARNRRKQKFIAIPSVYKQPKYRFGQMVKQGRIIGMEYYPPDLVKITDETEEWRYWLLENDEEILDLNMLAESEIEPLTSEELQAVVKDEIEFHQRSIAALREQIKQS